MIVRSCLAALVLAGAVAGAQQPTVVVRDAGPGPVGHYLQELLGAPGTRVIVQDTVSIGKDSAVAGALVVIGKRANVAGAVNGDVVVVGGDLFLKPGGRIEGQGVAIGGGAYTSLLGRVRDGLVSYRDFTYDAEQVAGVVELRYRENYVPASRSVFSLPALYGIRIPSYDRANGISLPIGPTIEVGGASVDLIATYRSQLGRVDPTVTTRMQVGRKLWLDAFAGRESRTNEDWINGRLSNSLNTLLNGHDERNWYRATAVQGSVSRLFETATTTMTYSIGAAFERSAPVRPGPAATGGPWSLTERNDPEDGITRPNPQIAGGDITSATGKAAYKWMAGTITAHLDVNLEVPLSVSTGESFTQTTVDGRVDFPTFGLQRYRLEVHGVFTPGDAAPGQRFSYIGGSGTLPTFPAILGFGGDQLLFIESRYEVPMTFVTLPFAGSPTITFRHILGAAGIQSLPELTQIVGARLSVPFVRVQWLIDTDTHKTRFTAGLSFSR